MADINAGRIPFITAARLDRQQGGNALTVYRSAVVDQFLSQTVLFNLLAVERLDGLAITTERRVSYGTVNNRALNEKRVPTEIGNTESVTISAAPIYKNFSFDQVFNTISAGNRMQNALLLEGVEDLQRRLEYNLFNGTQSINPRDMSGLREQITGQAVVSPNPAAPGTDSVLHITQLNTMIDAFGPDILAMHYTTAQELERTAKLNGWRFDHVDMFGQRLSIYRGVRIISYNSFSEVAPAIAYNEAGFQGGPAETSSIYGLKLGDSGVKFVQVGNGLEFYSDTGLATEAQDVTSLELWGTFHVPSTMSAFHIKGIQQGDFVV